MSNIIERLKNGEAICPSCQEVSHNFWANGLCGVNDQHEDEEWAHVIRWQDVLEGLPNESKQSFQWLKDNYPEVAEAGKYYYENPPPEMFTQTTKV